MDRTIVYPGSIPLDTDMLNLNRNVMTAIGALAAATLGDATVIDGLAVTPTSPASMNIQVGPGSITLITTVDPNAYGSLPADMVDPVLKMGINTGWTVLACPAPAATGESINYLLQASFSETDVDPVVLPYYNAADPTVPFLGPANDGGAQPTMRIQRVQLAVKAGTAAATGSQVTPSPDAGWAGVAAIEVDAGTASIGVGNIATSASAPVIPYKLPSLRPGFSSLASFTSSGVFVVPVGVTMAKITVVGGGGAGGSNATLPGGGGGAGGQAVVAVNYLVPGSAIPVTVGLGGVAAASGFGAGGNGGTSSFGTILSATGGIGGGAALSASAYTGGNGGTGVGGTLDYGGSFGTDGIPAGNRGGDGGGPGSGRGATGAPGLPGQGFGGGGGGGAAGFAGANGSAGLVIVEF
jgi:hypothetical protein